jgi:malonyl-CoA O-methyltransferase
MTAGLLTRWLRRSRPQQLPSQLAYAIWAETYPPYPHNPLMRLEQSILAPLITDCSPHAALDVGTGTGRYLSILRQAGATRVIGLDLSLAMLGRQAREARRVCADACALPFAHGQFDIVCSSLMAGDLVDLGAWVREAARVLVPGGHLLYSDFHPEWSRHGWRRTFTAADGRALELSFVPHAIEDHLRFCEDAGLQVRVIREPRLPGGAMHALVILHLEKPRPGVGVRPGDESRFQAAER